MSMNSRSVNASIISMVSGELINMIYDVRETVHGVDVTVLFMT